MSELIWAIICPGLAIVCLVISVLQFKEKGFLFNNAYIWAAKQERETMNKEPHYLQSGIAFALCALIFIFMALECVLLTSWLWLIVGAITVAVLVYAVTSSIKKQPNENTSIQHTYGQQSTQKGLLPILLLIRQNQILWR